MTSQSYDLLFRGFWRWGIDVDDIPNGSGIYCVHTGTYSQLTGNVSLSSLIYIGESQRVLDRIINHERMLDWKGMLGTGQMLCFSSASISPIEARDRPEAALIYSHKPLLNEEYKDTFPFGPTHIKTFGKRGKLKSDFRVP